MLIVLSYVKITYLEASLQVLFLQTQNSFCRDDKIHTAPVRPRRECLQRA